MKLFDCGKLTDVLTQVAEKLSILDRFIIDSIPEGQLSTRSGLETVIEPAVDWFGGDQIELRQEVAKEKGYSYISKFNKFGIARASIKKGQRPSRWILINTLGEDVLGEESESYEVTDFSDGIAIIKTINARRERECFFVNEKGKRINDKTYEDAKPYKFGRALVMTSTGHGYDLVDPEGNVLRKGVVRGGDELRYSNKGYLGFHATGCGAWYRTPDGERIPREMNKYFEDGMGDLNEGIAKVCDRLGSGQSGRVTDPDKQIWYYIDQEGNRLDKGILSRDLRAVTNFYKGRAYVQTLDGQIILTNVDGYIIKNIGNTDELGRIQRGIDAFSEGILVLGKNGAVAFDSDGEILIDGLENLSNFHDGIAFARKDGQSCLVNIHKEFVELKETYTFAGNFKDGVARLERRIDTNEKDRNGFTKSITEYFYIDKKGRRVFE